MGIADIHCHTHYSGINRLYHIPFPESVVQPERMVDIAEKRGLNTLAITDHNEIKGAYRAKKHAQEEKKDIDIIIGEEISTLDGEILGLFIQEKIPLGMTAEETIDIIHRQGGLAIAPHPYSCHCQSLGNRIKTLPLDGVETLNGFHRDSYANRMAEENTPRYLALMGGSDSHSTRWVGMAYTKFKGEKSEDLYTSIKKMETEPEGRPAHLRQCIIWSMEIPYTVIKTLSMPWNNHHLDEESPMKRVSLMKKRNKALALLGCTLYIASPLPYILGAVSEGIVRHRSKKEWNNQKNNK